MVGDSYRMSRSSHFCTLSLFRSSCVNTSAVSFSLSFFFVNNWFSIGFWLKIPYHCFFFVFLFTFRNVDVMSYPIDLSYRRRRNNTKKKKAVFAYANRNIGSQLANGGMSGANAYFTEYNTSTPYMYMLLHLANSQLNFASKANIFES